MMVSLFELVETNDGQDRESKILTCRSYKNLKVADSDQKIIVIKEMIFDHENNPDLVILNHDLRSFQKSGKDPNNADREFYDYES